MTNLDPIRSKRVPRFVEEYCKDRNATQAAMRAGYTQNPDAACSTGLRLLGDARIQGLIAEQLEKVSKEATVDAAQVLREWLDVATADPSKIMYVRRINCRHCHGVDHEYQWGARQYAEAMDAAMNAKKPTPLPSCSGGFGWRHNREPHPECPECGGEGREDVFFHDTESLTGPERKLIAGIKRTKDGLEVKMRDQDAAWQNVAKYLGLLVERRELTGKNGGPLAAAVVPVELPTDPKALAALYMSVMGGA
jgi:phage terminase small subunit